MKGVREEPILEISRRVGKTYGFDETHDETFPADMWFQESEEGSILFIVFYAMACRWSQCLGCNLPSRMSAYPVSYRSLMAQVDRVFRDPEVLARRTAIRKVILSNNGSMLDEATFSSVALMYLMAQLNLHLPNLGILSLETRPEYVDLAELEFLARALAEGETPTEMEIGIGFEAFDDRIRNEVFRKGLTLERFEALIRQIQPYRYRLKCYFMQKPVPGMTDGEAVDDIRCAIDYLSRIAAESGIHINMHINPTYVASGTPLEQSFRQGDYTPPRLQDVAEAARHARGKPVSVFLGLYDEGLAVEGGSFLRASDAEIVEGLERFNRSQDFDILDAL